MYRVDTRTFNINDSILPAEISYQNSSNFTSDKQKIEKNLLEVQPKDKAFVRNNVVYIFVDLSDAIRFCSRMSNSKIYRVNTLADTICYHRGDMNWTEIMNSFIANNKTLKEMAELYWQGLKTFKPCWEMLVNKIQVSNIIIADDNARNDLYREYNERSGNVEKMNFYIETLNQQY